MNNTYKTGDYAISLRNVHEHRYENDIIRVCKKIDNHIHYISKHSKSETSGNSDWREATQEEIDWHLLNPTVNLNLTQMPKESQIINTYSIY